MKRIVVAALSALFATALLASHPAEARLRTNGFKVPGDCYTHPKLCAREKRLRRLGIPLYRG